MEPNIKPFEKLLIKHRKPAIVFLSIIYVFLMGLFAYISNDSLLVAVILTIAFFVVLVLLTLIPEIRNTKIVKLRTETLELYKSFNANNELIELTMKSNKDFAATYCSNRIAYLIDMGNFEQAENEIYLFWRTFVPNKTTELIFIYTHIHMTIIALEKRDFKVYNEQMNIIWNYLNNNNKKNKLAKKQIDHSFKGLQFSFDIINATPETDTEALSAFRWDLAFTDPISLTRIQGNIPPYNLMCAYYDFFELYKNTNNEKLAQQNAQQVVNIGNEQFIYYRRAKEYLENANRSN